MPNLEALRPKKRERVIDLLAEVGHDVSDWANYAGGPAKAPTNPRYCYEWSFVQEGKPVVMNLWHSHLRKRGKTILQTHNFLRGASTARKTAWRTRARKMNHAAATAWEERLPVRVILCDGVMRDRKDPQARASQVQARELDPVSWAVTSYDHATGSLVVTRGAEPPRGKRSGALRLYPDEVSDAATYQEGAKTRVTVNAYERDARARRDCIRYHGYRCCVCELLFEEIYGELGRDFIHVHHVRSLASQGKRTINPITDLVPVCPNCHAMLHRRGKKALSPARLRKLLR